MGSIGVEAGRMTDSLKILFLAAEAAPLVKVGGLADVGGALPGEFRRRGHDARLVLPLHPGLRRIVAGSPPAARMMVPNRGAPMPAEAYRIEQEGCPVYLIDGPPLRAADAVYHSDSGRDAFKYVFFSLAALELTRALRWKPDIVHTNDWHTAAVNLWLALNREKDRHFGKTRSVLSIHNLPYLGQDAEPALAQFRLGVPAESVSHDQVRTSESNGPVPQTGPDRFSELPRWARSALLPLGIAAADFILTVSPSYAEEILTPEFGAGMDEFLCTRKDRLRGILNGLDTERWNPATDSRLAAVFDSSSMEKRAINRDSVAAAFGLAADPRPPLIAMVSRLTEQKGIDLALPGLDAWCRLGGRAAILGTGDPALEDRVRAFAARHPGRAGAVTAFDDTLAARIYAGADYVLVPSRYEPCGLSQMIAMRYGSLPIVHAVGGLRDTVRDIAEAGGTGIAFSGASPESAAFALGRAAEFFRRREDRQAAQVRCMAEDFSWAKSADAYLDTYRRALASQACHPAR
jgi:starch synthase